MDFLKELGIESINPGACSGPGQWSPVEGRHASTPAIRPRSSSRAIPER